MNKDNKDCLPARTTEIIFRCGKIFIICNFDDDGDVVRVEAHKGKTGNCQRTHLEKLCEMLSSALATKKVLLKKKLAGNLCGTICPDMPNGVEGTVPTSCHDAIGQLILIGRDGELPGWARGGK